MRITTAGLVRQRGDEYLSTDDTAWRGAAVWLAHPAAIPVQASTALTPWTPIVSQRFGRGRTGPRRYGVAGPKSASWMLPSSVLVLAWPPVQPISVTATLAPPISPIRGNPDALDEPEILEALEVLDKPPPAPVRPAPALLQPMQAPLPVRAPRLTDVETGAPAPAQMPWPAAESVRPSQPWIDMEVQRPESVPPPVVAHPPQRSPVVDQKLDAFDEVDAAEAEGLDWAPAELQPNDPDDWLDEDTWLVEPVPAGSGRTRRNSRLRYALAGLVALVAAGAGYAVLRQDLRVHQDLALFNAPMMVIKAASAGRIASVSVVTGQAVTAKSSLLSLQAGDGAGPPVLAGVNGVVRSVEVQAGADVVRGTPLIRLYDCDHSFLTLPTGTKIVAGEAVQVTISGQKPFTAVARASNGVAEPPDSVVVGIPAGSLAVDCPVGATATVTWDAKPTS